MDNTLEWFWNTIEKMVRCFGILFKKLTGKEISEQSINVVLQFVKFGIVGVSNSAIYYIVYVLSMMSFRACDLFMESDYLMAQVVAFVLSTFWAFFWNSKYVFAQDNRSFRYLIIALLKTVVSYAFTGLLLSEFLLWFWVNIWGISEYVAPILNLIICLPVNFILNKMWAFRKKTY